MNKRTQAMTSSFVAAVLVALSCLMLPGSIRAQTFDFDRLEKDARQYTVIIDMKIEFSFGMQSNEHEQRLIGTLVSEDGLVMFDGGFLSESNPLSPMSSFSFRADPTTIEITTLEDEKFDAEYVGVDRQTGLGFIRITDAGDRRFTPVEFVTGRQFKLGEWLAVFMLLPEFVTPPTAADVGMVSTLVTSPEEFALTVGFNSLEMASVLFDEDMRPVGVLGTLTDPSSSDSDPGGLMESMGQFALPLLGVITGERLDKLIADPPQKGKTDRAWLGITLQALTEDIAGFLNMDTPGGIIVNEVVNGSPASASGLQVGDVLYEINNQQIEVNREEELVVFQRRIADMGAGTSVEFSILRPVDETIDTITLLAVLEAAPLAASDAPEYENDHLEFKSRDLVFADYVRFNVEQGGLNGVVVSELKQGGLAYIGGLHLGDIIQRVDGSDITSVDELSASMALLESERPEEIIFFIWRFNKTLFVNVKTDWN
ncbi:MAG: PDZ domain-containing protein [bacterium]|nr:PDZ domain-containing protein [bacterium]